jgi:hypothetical protein
MRGSLGHVVQRHHIPDWKMAGVQVLMSAEVTGLQLPPRAYARRNEARKEKKNTGGNKADVGWGPVTGPIPWRPSRCDGSMIGRPGAS